jgi:arabinogalactan oligomer / maltooligosaccharide transport system permease protein
MSMRTLSTDHPAKGKAKKVRPVSSMVPGERLGLWTSRIIVWVFVVLAILPMYFVFEASINPANTYVSFSLFPAHPTLSNYRSLFSGGQYFVWLRNSLTVSIVSGVIQVFITAFGAFAFSRLRFLGRKYGLLTLILLQMFPNFLAISAFYAVMSNLHMMDMLWSYILVVTGGSAFNIWLLKGYFDTVPRELDEAAFMDGASTWQRFVYILLPLSTPMLVVIFLFTVIGLFGDYVFSGMILQSPQNYTLAVGLYTMISGQFAKNWGEFSAAALMAAVPLAILFGLGQRYMSTGLVAGASKG